MLREYVPTHGDTKIYFSIKKAYKINTAYTTSIFYPGLYTPLSEPYDEPSAISYDMILHHYLQFIC
jgi:hypothetical protein